MENTKNPSMDEDLNRNQPPARKRMRGRQDVENRKLEGALSGREDLCHVHEVPAMFHEPFIVSGYRNRGMFISLSHCFTTMFSIHNETVNIWSHLAAVAVFAVYFLCKFKTMEIEFTQNAHGYPLLCFAFATCLLFLSSAMAHFFSCISANVYHICFYFDYAAISIFTLTASQAFYFYSRPYDPDSLIFNSPYIYLGTSAALSLTIITTSCLSRHYLQEYRLLLRVLPNVVKIIFDTWPFVARINQCGTSMDCNAVAITFFYRHWLCYFISAATYATKIPERWMPGVFDFFGHSHHFLHLVGTLGNYYAFTAVALDCERRAEILAKMPAQPTFYSTIGMLLVMVCAAAVIVGAFTYRCLREQEKSGKDALYMNGTDYRVAYSSEGTGCEKKTS